MRSSTRAIEQALAAAAANRFNAWTTIDHEAIPRYERASEGSERERILEGMPCGVKDNIDVAGLPTAEGSAYPAVVSTRDAQVVGALRAAGAVIVGKHAMHEIAYGATGMVSATAPVMNPRSVERMPGGSSSGSAAAVAAGDVPFAIGTDTGGSVRVPAALCGVVGLRPTTGRLQSSGVRPLSPTLDTVGILAASVGLTRVVWRAISGAASRSPAADDAALSVGVVVDDYFIPESAAITEAVRCATTLLEQHGATVTPVRLGWTETMLSIYAHIVGVEAALVQRNRLSERLPGLQPETYRRLAEGARTTRQMYDEALRQRARIVDDLLRVFDHCDVLICPTTAIIGPRRDQKTAKVRGRTVDVGRALVAYTAPWSLTGNPALVVPFGIDPYGQPLSIQLVGKHGCETRVLDAGSIVEAHYKTAARLRWQERRL
ncbi:amidase [Mycolicibacterium smegmatis]|uniref:amidase n=1 Tax=Mycolicibacterium smegmatis (strain MKD8) TaxID=1214915 RepID=A0A2U9PTG8_MYCSE|nr:amidase [Mycolicibacterium smegmatis]AWT55028.1 glutamyl-tRNA(Gln) amidotransferase subunit A [Mycolicibacterium smegmatis MKD8]